MCGHGIVAVTTMAIERALIRPREPAGSSTTRLPVPCTPARTSASGKRGGRGIRVDRVAFDNVPSFVFAAGCGRVGNREVRVDVAFGGAFYAIVDAEAAGLPITPARLPELRRVGMESSTPSKPQRPSSIRGQSLNGIYGTIFTGPPERSDAD